MSGVPISFIHDVLIPDRKASWKRRAIGPVHHFRKIWSRCKWSIRY